MRPNKRVVETAGSLFSFQISPRITRIDAHTEGLRIEPRIAQGGSAATEVLTADNADNTHGAKCVHGISHEVLWQCEASSHRFSAKGPAPQKATRGRTHSIKSRDCLTKHKGVNLRKLPRFSSRVVRIKRMLGIETIAFEKRFGERTTCCS